MKLVRFRGAGRKPAYGMVDKDVIVEIRGSIYSNFRLTDARLPLQEVKLLAPTEPDQILGPGPNFADHLAYAGSLDPKLAQRPSHPQPWHKGRNALTGPGEPIILPRDSRGQAHHEGEAVAVIKKPCRRVSPAQARDYILGYTCGNDVSERDWQKEDWTMWRAKGADTFAPVGPWIETDVDPQNLEMIVRVNGQEAQRANTRDMLFTFAEIVSYISQHVTLKPGDLVFSGTTGATRALKPGDVVDVEIPGIGVLSNPVVAEFCPGA